MEFRTPTYEDPSDADEQYRLNFPELPHNGDHSGDRSDQPSWNLRERLVSSRNQQDNVGGDEGNAAQGSNPPAYSEEPYEPPVSSQVWHSVPISSPPEDLDKGALHGETDRLAGTVSSASASSGYLDEGKVAYFGSPFSQKVATVVLVASVALLLCSLISGFFTVVVGGLINLTTAAHAFAFIFAIIALSFDCLCHTGLLVTSVVGITSGWSAFSSDPNNAIKLRYRLAQLFVGLLTGVTVFYACLSILKVIPGLFEALFLLGDLTKVVGLFISSGILLCCFFGICGPFIALGLVQLHAVHKDRSDIEKGELGVVDSESPAAMAAAAAAASG